MGYRRRRILPLVALAAAAPALAGCESLGGGDGRGSASTVALASPREFCEDQGFPVGTDAFTRCVAQAGIAADRRGPGRRWSPSARVASAPSFCEARGIPEGTGAYDACLAQYGVQVCTEAGYPQGTRAFRDCMRRLRAGVPGQR